MAILYPTYENLKGLKVPLSEGEMYMVDFLRENLDNEYELFVQPYINGDRPDLILLRKGGGVLIIEVKDWEILRNKSRIEPVLSQVLTYKYNLIDLHIPKLLEYKLKDKKYQRFINCLILFYKNNQITVDETIQYNKGIDIIGFDKLEKEYLQQILYKSRINIDQRLFSNELYLSFKESLNPAYHSKASGIEYNLTKKQAELSVSKPGEQKIKGVVGSGKTLVLARRAVEAHKRTNDNVLILTYNISLINYIHDRINNVREEFDWKYFHISNYHEFISAQMNNLGLKFEIPENFDNYSNKMKSDFFENYYDCMDLFKSTSTNIIKYKSIFIDEVQDYKTAWLRIIKEYFLEPGGEFVVFGDSKQDIYNRVSLINNKKSLQIPDSPGRWAELNKSFRLTPTITKFSEDYQKHYLSDEHSADEFDETDFQDSLYDTVHYKYFDNLDSEKVADFISTYSKAKRNDPNEVCILSLKLDTIREVDFHYRTITKEKTYIMSETKEYYDKLKNEIKTKNRLNWELEKIRKNKKFNFWLNSGLTKFSTVHSFKGWEIKNLFLIIEKDSNQETYKELIYTGFTRCVESLVIVNIGDKEFSEFIDNLDYVEYV